MKNLTGEVSTEKGLKQANSFAQIVQEAVLLMENRCFATRAEIFAEALKHFRRVYPEFDAVNFISDRMGLPANSLYQKIQDKNRHFTLPEVEAFFRICAFPEGFIAWQLMAFNMEAKVEA